MASTRRHRSFALVVGVVLAVALAMRTVPLYWSPLPSTLDSFLYARLASDTLVDGSMPITPDLRADNLVLTSAVAVASLVTGERPVHVIQPALSVVGATTCVVAVAFTRRLAADLQWPPRRVTLAALTAGLLLAVQGLFLRRTTVPDPEVIGLLFTLLAVLACHRALTTQGERGRRWLLVLAIFVGTFPILHQFSTFNAAMALTALVGAELARRPTRRTFALGGGVLAVFWTLFVGYYELVARLDVLQVTYAGRIQSHPGLFLAWLVAMLVAVAWYQQTTARAQRTTFLLPVLAGFALVVANVATTVFPGTIRSPPTIAALVSLLVVPALFAGYGTPSLASQYRHATPVLALLAAPLVVMYFSMTATLTPEYFGTVMRAQTFVHVPVFVLVGLAAATIATSTNGALEALPVRGTLIAALVVCTLATVPLAFLTLDTAHFPATTAESEFQTTGFTAHHVDGPWTSHHPQTKLASQYFRSSHAEIAPTRTWLADGPPPACPVLTQQSWTTHGAHFWPSQPLTIPAAEHEAFLTERNLVYSTSGRDPMNLALSLESTDGC